VIVTIIGCPTCNARNRVGSIAQGIPRCPRCKSALPWVVEADTDAFTAETTASVPVVVDFLSHAQRDSVTSRGTRVSPGQRLELA
jgi:hypothetical protein